MVAVTDVLTVHGGTPLAGAITVRGAKNFVSKAMVAALLGEEPSRLANVPQIRDVTVVTGLLELHGVQVTESSPSEGGPGGGRARARPQQRRARPRRRHRRARGVEPDPDPVLRTAAAPARRGLHP